MYMYDSSTFNTNCASVQQPLSRFMLQLPANNQTFKIAIARQVSLKNCLNNINYKNFKNPSSKGMFVSGRH